MSNRLRNSKKDLINIKNNDKKCFLWCHIRHLNPLKTHPERITKMDRQMVDYLDYDDTKFPDSKKDYGSVEKNSSICIIVIVVRKYC